MCWFSERETCQIAGNRWKSRAAELVQSVRQDGLSPMCHRDPQHNREGAWKARPCWHRKIELWMHWTDKAHFWVGCFFSNREKLLKKKTCKITDWSKPSSEAIIQLIQKVVLSLPCKSDVWNSCFSTTTVSTDRMPNYMTFWIMHWLSVATRHL